MITEELKRVILNTLQIEEWQIEDETVASQVPGWDSLSHVNVILAVEEHFGVRFRSSEILKLRCLGDLQRLVDAKKRG